MSLNPIAQKAPNVSFCMSFSKFYLVYILSLLGASAVICNSILCVMINELFSITKTVKCLIYSFVSPFFQFHGDHSVPNNCNCFKNLEAA